ncbi:VacJ family lipoprotein [Arcobacter sp. LA11]|uniref:MlaA family lipoprotein n=1 Tax=Arcobacter sp. LA11 TaxID=1898176 RepID=UPI0009F8BC6D|nr:VacJ family lipoprotein [Arcobacter sp. LA11]
MKNLIIFLFIIITFNACSVTSHYKVTENLEFEYVNEKDRKTYELFGKERAIKEIQKDSLTSNDEFEDDFSDEFKDAKESMDPLEPYNRVMTSFNDFMYINFLTPVAKGYAEVVPEEARVGISNFLHNITFPIRFVNNILQFKINYAAEELGRFAVNSTVGILGFMDPAKESFNLEKREEDFGQTLGYYGVGEGFHIVLPIYGPSNLRDVIGSVGDNYINPLTDVSSIKYKIPDRPEKTLGITVFSTLNRTSLNLGKYENLKKDAIDDLYPFLKDIYTQNREKLIKE